MYNTFYQCVWLTAALLIVPGSVTYSNPDVPGPDRLVQAALDGDTAKVKALLAAGAGPHRRDRDRRWALVEAIRADHHDTAELLISRMVAQTMRQVRVSSRGSKQVGSTFAAFEDALQAAAKNDDRRIFRRLLLYERGAPTTPPRGHRVQSNELLAASALGDARTIRMLLKQDRFSKRKTEALARLLAAGADKTIKDRDDHTALDWARAAGRD